MAAVESIKFAGDVNIEKIEIVSNNGFYQDVTNQVRVIEIYEDLFSPFISGSLTFKDSLDLPNLFPFTGEEYVNLKIRTPSYDKKEMIIEDQFYLYRMSDRDMVGDRNLIYQLHFISREGLVDMNKKVSFAFQGKISEIAKLIVKDVVNGLESTKSFNSEETPNTTKFISNWWSPVKAINYAADTATNNNQAANYLFFENRYGFNFMSMEALYSSDVYQQFTYDAYMRDFRPDGTSIRNVEREYQRIVEITVPVVYDYLDRSQMGMFASKLIAHDITTKKYTVKGFDMLQNFDKEIHLNKYPITSEKNIRKYNNLVINYPKYHGNFTNYTDVTNSRTLQQRLSKLKQARANAVEIVVPGRTDYTVGQKVYLKLNKFNPIKTTDSDQDILDQVLSGNYLVCAINHFIDREKHQCHMELIKDSFILDLDKGK